MPLSDHLIASLPDAMRGAIDDPARLEALLERMVSEAHDCWPGVRLLPERFVAFVAERVTDGPSVEAAVEGLKLDELFLVCACLEGDPQAERIFERSYLPDTKIALSRIRGAEALADDVMQNLYQKLLVSSDAGQAPRLARYSGRGELRSWLRVTATRAALDILRGGRKERSLDDEALMDHLAAPGEDQELQFLKQHYRNEFKTAFQQTLATLSSRDRNVLRLQLLDGLNIDEVGTMYKVHRATVARWNNKIRETLLATTRRALLERLQISKPEFESIMRLIQSQFDVSICRHLDD